MKLRIKSFGDICESRAYLSIETHPPRGWCFSIGKTYVGTVAGLVIGLGQASLLAHIREQKDGKTRKFA